MTNTEYMRIWRNKNRERYRQIINKATAKWRRLHPAAVKAKIKDDQNRLFGWNREKVFQRDEYKCVVCAKKSRLSIDHIDGDRKNNSLRNLQTLCFACHGHKDGLRGWKKLNTGRSVRVTLHG